LDAAAVRLRNGLADGQAQPDPGNGGPAHTAGPEELREHFNLILAAHAHPGITDPANYLFAVLRQGHHHVPAVGRVFDGVRDEIVQHLGDAGTIHVGIQPGGRVSLEHHPGGVSLGHGGCDAGAHQFGHVHGMRRHDQLAVPGGEQVRYQGQQTL
jgi:hypothetical protein